MGLQRCTTVARDPVGRLGRRLFRARREHPRARGPRPARDDGGLRPRGGGPVRDRRGAEPARPRPRRRRSRPRRASRRSTTATSIEPKEIVLRIRARYRQFGLYETAVLGMLAQSTGWATAARECVDAAAPDPVISFGARHVHPDITDVLDYAAIVGGCVGASTPAGARLAGLAPTGTMPHSLVLIFGDTVEAALAFDRHVGAGGAADRARRHVQGRGRGGAPRRARAGRPAVRDPARHAVGARPGDRRPRPRGPGPPRPGRLRPRQDHRLGRADPGSDRATSRRPARRSTRTRSGRTSAAPRRSTSPATSRRSTAARSPSAAASPG